MKIGTKLQIAFISTSILIATSILIVFYFSMATHFERQEGERLKSNVRHSATVIDDFMFNRVADFNVLSNNPLFSSSSDEIISDYLLRVIKQYPFYENLFLVDKNGIVLSSSDQEFIGENILQFEPDIEDEFIKTINGGSEDVFISDVSEISGKEIKDNSSLDIELLSDVIDLNGNVVGVLVGFIKMQELEKLIFNNDHEIIESENIFLISDKGIVLMSGDKEIEILQQYPDLFIVDLLQKSKNNKNDFYIYKNSKDIKVISGYADLAEYGSERVGNWSLISTAPYNEVMKPIYKMLYKVFFTFLLLISLILVLIIIFSRKFAKPLIELEQAVTNFGINGKVLKLNIPNKDEIGSLYKSFITMTRNLNDLSEERDSTEQKLIAAKEFSENLIMSMQEGLIISDIKGEIILVNDAFCKLTGYLKKELIGMDAPYPFWLKEDSEAIINTYTQITNDSKTQFEFNLRRKNGETFSASFLTGKIKNEKNEIIAFFGSMKDISEEKRSKEILLEKVEKSKRNSDVILKLASLVGEDFQTSLEIITSLASNNLNVERVGIWKFNEDKTEASCEKLYVLNNNKYEKGALLKYDDNPNYFNALYESKTILIKDAQKDSVTKLFNKDYLIPNNITSLMDVFINATVGYYGIICFEHVGEGLRDWSAEDQEFASSIASIVSLMVESSERKIAERKLIIAKEDAEESKNYLNNIINNIGDPVFVKDEQSKLLLINDAFCKMFNLSRIDMIGKTLAESVPVDEQEIFFKIDKQVLSTGIENVNEETFTLLDTGERKETRIISTKKTRVLDLKGNKLLIGTIRDITESKKTEELIKVSNERFEIISIATNDVIWDWNLVTNKVWWNDKYYSHFGYPRKEDLLDVDSWYDGLYPEDKEGVIESIHHAIENKEKNWGYEYRFLKADGTPIFILDRGYILYDKDGTPYRMVGAMLDVSESKKAEKEIRAANQRITTHLNNSPLAIIEWDEDFIICNWSEQAKNIFGWEASEAIGKNFIDLNMVYEEDAEAISIINDKLMSGKVKSNMIINRNYTKTNKIIYCQWYNSVLRSTDGQIETIFSLAQDITERKNAESELDIHRNHLEELVEVRTTELEKEKVKAQSADLMKSAFLATMSHELRTPMNSIIGFTGILLKEFAGPLNEEQKKQLSMVKNSGQHLLGLINDVLDVSKIEAGKLKLTKAPFNYLTTVEKTIDFLVHQASKKNLTINSEISEQHIIFTSDERRVEQVLLNLITNAIKFSTKGAIQVKVDIVDNIVVTQIIDQGIGIDKKELNKLFMPFIQLESGLNRTHEGTGLGLAICKKLIEKLGGTIQVHSKVGIGSNFTFKLPLDKA